MAPTDRDVPFYLDWFQLAFPRDPLMLFASTLDAILAFTVSVGENPGHDADATRYILTSGLLEDYSVPDLEFWGHPLALPISAAEAGFRPPRPLATGFVRPRRSADDHRHSSMFACG